MHANVIRWQLIFFIPGTLSVLQSENNDVDLLRVPVGLTSNTRTTQHYSISDAGSIANPSSTNFKNQHRFTASTGSSIVALLGNSAVFFIRENTTTMQTELHGTVLYAEGCRANHLQPSHSDHFVYVTFENCPPLRVTVADLAALVAPHSDLTDKKVLTVDALDFDTDMITFHIYIDKDLSRIQILASIWPSYGLSMQKTSALANSSQISTHLAWPRPLTTSSPW